MYLVLWLERNNQDQLIDKWTHFRYENKLKNFLRNNVENKNICLEDVSVIPEAEYNTINGKDFLDNNKI